MTLYLGRRRALRDIARDLADSDPRLGELFFSFAQLAGGGKMPGAEKIRARPLRLIARVGRRERPASGEFQGPAAWWRWRMLNVRVVSPATLTRQLAAAPGVATGSDFAHRGGIAIEGGAG
jgi:hypothetical protein